MNQHIEVLLKKGDGDSLWVLGDLYTFKVTGKETNGAYTLIEQIVQPQNGPPPHIHRAEDEAFYILEGRFSFMCNGKESIFEAGSFVHIPKGTLHTFRNAGTKQGKLLVFITPAGLENFFYAVGTIAEGTSGPPPFDPSVIDKIMTLAGKYHMDVILPKDKE